MSKVFSLYELNRLIRSVIDTAFPQTLLVTAEIASCDVKNHCYLTLVDKEEDTIRAETKAVIWANRYRTLARSFRKATGVELSKGIKILFEASLNFHERYGLKLTIDPSYTIGEMAVRRKEILEKLSKEGLKDKNKQLEFPLVPQRIGIISSATAAGYEDFMNHLVYNAYGYKYTCMLFEARMQGEHAEESIISALHQCADDELLFDVVVIIRGGGGQADLHCFDSYEIGKYIAKYPMPVISGIGHERDLTVVDEVSSIRVKTPTAAADLIITRTKDFEDNLDLLGHRVLHGIQRLTADMREGLSYLTTTFDGIIRNKLLNDHYTLNSLAKGLQYSLKLLKVQRQRVKTVQTNINHLNPFNVLKRGYSITYHDRRSVRSSAEVKTGDRLTTKLYKGELVSRVERKHSKKRGI
jgi:exodeoxyribonuclease VII large subunit